MGLAGLEEAAAQVADAVEPAGGVTTVLRLHRGHDYFFFLDFDLPLPLPPFAFASALSASAQSRP